MTTARRGVGASGRRLPRWAAPVGVAAAAAVATVALALRSPHVPGSWGACPSLLLTGLWCPACGGLRAVHELTHGDVGAALGYNAPVVLGLPLVAALWVWWLLTTLGRAPTSGRLAGVVRRALSPPGAWVLLGLAALFMVLRNLPGLEVLAPL